MKSQKLPVIKKKKMIDVKKFVKLANKVRKSLEEEGRIPDPDNPNGNNNPAGIFFNR
jgi:hypothetical protein